jgi:hypothetical protein
LALWSLTGLFIDGWAHNNNAGLESFFTPWHGILYAGFTATAAWMGRQVLEAKGSGPWRLSSIPVGYALGLVGIALISIGGVVDFAWHEAFGFDDGVKSPFSPPHLVLMIGGLLVVSTPARATWSERQEGTSLRSIFVPMLSLTMTVALGMFFLNYHSAFFRNLPPTSAFSAEIETLDDAEHASERSLVGWLSDLDDGRYPYEHYSTVAGTSAILISNLMMMAIVLLLVRRFRMPFGAVTLMFAMIGVLFATMSGFRDAPVILPLVVGGLAADVLIRRWKPYGSERVLQFRLLAGAVPVILWSTYLIVLHVAYDGIGWPVPVWSGVVLMSALAGVALSLLMAPTPMMLDVDEATAPSS